MGKKIRYFTMFMLIGLVLTACSNDDDNPTEVSDIDNEVTDDILLGVVEANAESVMNQDEEAYMETIHSESPFYEDIADSLETLFEYDVEVEFTELYVEEKSAEEASVFFIETMKASESEDFQDQETTGRYILKPDGETWKIFNSEQMDVRFLSEGGVSMEGEYADALSAIEKPFDEAEWKLVEYLEDEGEARAEYIPLEENLGNYLEMVTIDYYENGNVRTGLAPFLEIMEESLREMTTGTLQFDHLLESETEVIYEFSLTDDDSQADQHELGRVYVEGDDFFIIRYTSMHEKIDNKQMWLEALREVQ